MPVKEDRNEIRRRVRRVIAEDGLLETMIGVSLLLASIRLFQRSFVLVYLWIPVAVLLIEMIRKRYVYSRTGFARISISTREIMIFAGMSVAAIAVLAGLMYLGRGILVESAPSSLNDVLPFALIVYTTVFFCFVAWRFRIPRWYAHGIALGIVLSLGKLYSSRWLVIALGVWMLVVGLRVFHRFMLECSEQPGIDGSEEQGV